MGKVMEKKVLLGLLSVLPYFKAYSAGRGARGLMWHYLGPCPRCKGQGHLRLQVREGGWKCPHCKQIVQSREVPELAQIATGLLSL